MRTTLLSVIFLAGVSLTASAQFKIGGKTINTKKVVSAATDVAKAVTLSDADIVAMSREYIGWIPIMKWLVPIRKWGSVWNV